MIVARVYDCAGGPGAGTEIEAVDISDYMNRADTLLWAHVDDPTDDDLACIQEEFSLHALAMEDVRERHQRPKLETYPDHSFLVAYTGDLEEIQVFVAANWMVSVAHGVDMDPFRARLERTRPQGAAVGYLVYTLLDQLVDGYFDATDEIEEVLEGVEDVIFDESLGDEREVQRRLFDVRRRLMLFRRAVVPLRDVVAALLRREADWIDDTTAVRLQDVFDHVLRATELIDSQRELMGNAVDAHLAIISNRVNAVMKRMTSWGAILLGSTLVAGIYGMNFEHMPELHWTLGYPFALGVMLAITLGGYRWFRNRDWL